MSELLFFTVLITLVNTTLTQNAYLKILADNLLLNFQINSREVAGYDPLLHYKWQSMNIQLYPGDQIYFIIQNNDTKIAEIRFCYDITFTGSSYVFSSSTLNNSRFWTSNLTIPISNIHVACYQFSFYSRRGDETVTFTGILPFAGKCKSYIKVLDSENDTELLINLNSVFSLEITYKGWEDKYPFKLASLSKYKGSVIHSNSTVLEINKIYTNMKSFKYSIPKDEAIATIYLDSIDMSNNQYNCPFIIRKCFKTCDNCSYLGTHNMHKCLSCKEGSDIKLIEGNCIECKPNWFYERLLVQCVEICQYTSTIINNIPHCVLSCSSNEKYNYKKKCYNQIDIMTELGISSIITHEYKWNIPFNDIKDNIEKENITEFLIDLQGVVNETYFTITFPKSDQVIPDECENLLRKHYNIPENDSLLLIALEELQSNITQTNYYVYDKQYSLLDYSLCNGQNIIISGVISPELKINLEQAKELSMKGINVFDPKDSFFNDICYPYLINDGLDMLIKDKRNDLFQNITLCQADCILINVDFETKEFNCSCTFNIDPSPNTTSPESVFVEAVPWTNLLISKCYQHFIYNKDILSNIGFWVLSGVIFIFLITGFLSCNLQKVYVTLDKERKKSRGRSITQKTRQPTSLLPDTPLPITLKVGSDNKIVLKHRPNRLKDSKKVKPEADNRNDPVDNNIPYTKALIKDNRSIVKIFWNIFKDSYVLFQPFTKQSIYDFTSIKLAGMICSIALQLTINSLFYNDDLISEKYKKNGQLLLMTSFFKSIYSFLVNGLITRLSGFLIAYQDRLQIISKEGQNEKEYHLLLKKELRKIKLKITIFFIMNFLLILCSLYYLTIFCTVYKGSRVSLFIDEGVSLGISSGITIIGSFICSSMRYCSLERHKRSLYFISNYLRQFI